MYMNDVYYYIITKKNPWYSRTWDCDDQIELVLGISIVRSRTTIYMTVHIAGNIHMIWYSGLFLLFCYFVMSLWINDNFHRFAIHTEIMTKLLRQIIKRQVPISIGLSFKKHHILFMEKFLWHAAVHLVLWFISNFNKISLSLYDFRTLIQNNFVMFRS